MFLCFGKQRKARELKREQPTSIEIEQKATHVRSTTMSEFVFEK
jgi:hypothetical protein